MPRDALQNPLRILTALASPTDQLDDDVARRELQLPGRATVSPPRRTLICSGDPSTDAPYFARSFAPNCWSSTGMSPTDTR